MVELEKQDFKKNKELYNKIEEQLRTELDDNILVEHVGSTAIPDMYGKNIIDILVGAKTELEFEDIFNKIKDLGYIPSERKGIYQFFANTKEETKSGDIHIHLVMKNTERFEEFLILRDYLLNNPNEATGYSNFKIKIIQKYSNNRQEYKKIKSEYVTNLLKKAKNFGD